MYSLTKSGRCALAHSKFLRFDANMVGVLHDIAQTQQVGTTQPDILSALVAVGFVQRDSQHNFDQSNLQPLVDSNQHISQLKKQFVTILKNKFSGSNELWDILINLETVTDRNGLIWFMSQVIEKTPVTSRSEYEAVLRALLEMADE